MTTTNTIFFDDFSAPELDRSKWNVYTTGRVVNEELQAYVDSSETIYIAEAPGAEKRVLVLHPRYRPGFTTPEGKSFDFISGRIHTREKFEFQYGSAAARIKLPAGSGFWPAFWALGKQGNWPDCGEIDIMEYTGETDWASAALHGPGYFRETPLFNKVYFAPENDATNWHVYSVDWTAEALIFKVDNTLIYRVTRPMIQFYGEWVFDTPEYLLLNFAIGGIFPFKVNGVKEPYLGLPETTAQMIKDDQAKVLVDWVKVTQTK